jgi:predicted HicB family RNase H-like nuclease
MPEQSTERKIHIRVEEGLHRRLRIRCAELDTTIQDFVVKLLGRELVDDGPHQAEDHRKPGRK